MREIILLIAILLIPTAAIAADAPATQPSTQPASAAIDNPMLADPLLTTVPNVLVFDPRDKPLWLAALARPEADMRRQAADAIGLAASQGMPALADTAPALAAMLDSDTRPIVRQSCVQALYRLGAKQFAPNLLKHDGDDWQTMLIADAALSAWDFAPAHALWRARLTDPLASGLAVRSAIRAMGGCPTKNADDDASILIFAIDSARGPALRLEAATQFARMGNSGLDFDSERLAHSQYLNDRLVAATVFGSYGGTNARRLLLELADDPEPLVVVTAARSLLDIDLKSLAPLDAKLATSEDFTVRMLAVQVLSMQQSAAATELLATMLADPNPQIRARVRDSLLALRGAPTLSAAVSDGAVKMVTGENWRGIEQALLLLGATGDHHADQRITELLSDQQPVLRIAATVAVRRLRIAAAMPALADRCAEIMATFKQEQAAAKAHPKLTISETQFTALGEEGSQIAQTLGVMDYAPADAMLRELVPKSTTYPSSMRSSAIWALGKLHAGTPDAKLVKELLERAADNLPTMPESPDVQIMAVEAIGMMRATHALPRLQQLIADSASTAQFGAACRWAIGQITGQQPPAPPADHVMQHGFFLESGGDGE